MIMSFIITLIFEFIFIVNIVLFWLTFSKKIEHPILHRYYKGIFPYIWTISLVIPLILNSYFLQFLFPANFSYLQDLWIWFLILGIIFIIVGIWIISNVRKIFKVAVVSSDDSKIINSGPYKVVRHPLYLAWALIFTGWSFILDSPLTILYSPILIVLLNIHSIYEERSILLPKYDNLYIRYCEKVPYRMFSPPYNYLIIIIGMIVAYIGLANFFFES